MPAHKLRISSNGDPLIKTVFMLLRMSDTPVYRVAEKAGLNTHSLSQWRRRQPGLFNFKAVLNTLGYDLEIVELKSRKPFPLRFD